MAASLKSLCPSLAEILGTTTDAVYERQRALIAGGLLELVGTGGPGSGVRATPRAVATLILGTMTTEKLADSASGLRKVVGLKPVTGFCGLTFERKFLSAVATSIADVELAERVAEIRVSRTLTFAKLEFYTTTDKFTEFTDFGKPVHGLGIATEAVIDGMVVVAANKIIRERGVSTHEQRTHPPARDEKLGVEIRRRQRSGDRPPRDEDQELQGHTARRRG